MAIEQPKIYTEYDAERRAQEIVGNMLHGCIDRLEAMEEQAIVLLKRNNALNDELKRAKEGNERLLHAVIYYDETYNRLTDERKAEFREIGKGVINDYNLPFKE